MRNFKPNRTAGDQDDRNKPLGSTCSSQSQRRAGKNEKSEPLRAQCAWRGSGRQQRSQRYPHRSRISGAQPHVVYSILKPSNRHGGDYCWRSVYPYDITSFPPTHHTTRGRVRCQAAIFAQRQTLPQLSSNRCDRGDHPIRSRARARLCISSVSSPAMKIGSKLPCRPGIGCSASDGARDAVPVTASIAPR